MDSNLVLTLLLVAATLSLEAAAEAEKQSGYYKKQDQQCQV